MLYDFTHYVLELRADILMCPSMSKLIPLFPLGVNPGKGDVRNFSIWKIKFLKKNGVGMWAICKFGHQGTQNYCREDNVGFETYIIQNESGDPPNIKETTKDWMSLTLS